MSIAASSELPFAPGHPLLIRFVVALACAALADWLFYGWQAGISIALFLGTLGILAIASNRVHATRNVRIALTVVFVAGLLALIEDVNILSVLVGTLATALFVVVITTSKPSSWLRDVFEVVTIPLRGPFQLAGDLLAALRLVKKHTPDWLKASSLVAWIIPLAAFAVFLGLFASANPLIEYRLMQIDLRSPLNFIDPARIGFWILLVCAIWPLILRRAPRLPVWQPEPRVATEPFDLDYLFGAQAVTRSLILFNALFGLQTGLDLTYLWGGANLPGGMSYAEYAHRGAYPLIVTALLAAGFVLIAMRPAGPSDQSKLIRPLVLVWTGQNILLVVSSILRLDLYVAAYSLTYLRLAAFIWMLLVAAGLLSILIQILLRRPNSWLLAANAATLAAVLYACCFINAPWLVASYNVEHCQEVGGTGPKLDLQYLSSLGAQSLPPLEAHPKEFPGIFVDSLAHRMSEDRNSFEYPGNWRAWTFRTWRLERYFANKSWLNPENSSGG